MLARVFSIDVTECPDCGGRMKIIAALTEPASIRSYLEGVGLPARPPPTAVVGRFRPRRGLGAGGAEWGKEGQGRGRTEAWEAARYDKVS